MVTNKSLTGLIVFAFILLLIVFWSAAYAAPFLVCDPQEGVTSYVVTMNGSVEEVPAQDLGNNTTRLHYDLNGIASGTYDCNITAKNVWGESEPVPFSFSKTIPGCPSALNISAQ